MNCNQIRELLPDLAAGMNAATPELTTEINKHVASCHDCAAHLRDLQKTMALLDEWQAPEPSPYFDTRMTARLREEMARPQPGWLSWLRRPAWAMSLAAVFFAGALTIGVVNNPYFRDPGAIATAPPSLGLPVEPGTAVGDLQALEKNDDLYADFDMLDDLQVQDDVNANP
ncbi:MAG: zf-HC2 domain-containing protein [Terriglobales bacterium]